MKLTIPTTIAALGLALSPLPVFAQSYSPDVLDVSESGPVAFDPTPRIDLADGGAVEFWVAANWQDDPGYDPPVIVNIGPEGILYQISILRERDGLVFANANDEDVFIADLSDGNLHHVSLNFMEDGIEAYVDGALVGTSELLPLSLPSVGLFIAAQSDFSAGELLVVETMEELP